MATFHRQNTKKQSLNSLCHVLIVQGIGLKQHTFNIKHYLHESHLHIIFIKGSFWLTSNNETTQKKKLFREVC